MFLPNVYLFARLFIWCWLFKIFVCEEKYQDLIKTFNGLPAMDKGPYKQPMYHWTELLIVFCITAKVGNASITGVTYRDHFDFEARYRNAHECDPIYWHPLHLPDYCVEIYEKLIRANLEGLSADRTQYSSQYPSHNVKLKLYYTPSDLPIPPYVNLPVATPNLSYMGMYQQTASNGIGEFFRMITSQDNFQKGEKKEKQETAN